MNEAHLNKRYSSFVIGMLLLFPVAISSVKILGNFILLIFVLLGVYIVINEKKNPFKIQELKVFSWLTVSYFCVMLLSILIADGFQAEFSHLGRKVHFLLAPLIAVAIYKVEFPLKFLLISIKVGLIISGLIVLYQYFSGVTRPSGMFNANIFGDIVVLMFYLSLVNLSQESFKDRIFSITSSFFAILSIVLSGNRGSILLLFVLGVFYLYFVLRKFYSNKSRSKIFPLIIFSVLVILIANQPIVKSGVSRVSDTIESWMSGNKVMSSSGIRLLLWQGGISAFQDSPIFGVGYRNANKVVATYVEPEFSNVVKRYSHLHNEYITNLVSAGLLGLFSLLLLLLLPLKIYIKNLKEDNKFLLSFMGVILVLSYIGFGFTHIAFGEEHVNAVFVFFTAIILPKMHV